MLTTEATLAEASHGLPKNSESVICVRRSNTRYHNQAWDQHGRTDRNFCIKMWPFWACLA